MNRRDLFRGAGALALSAAIPPTVPGPVLDWNDLGVVDGLSSIHGAVADALVRSPWFLAYRREFEDELLHGRPDREGLAFDGLTPRYADLPPGDNTSIWLVHWE